ncbi:ATP-dependent RNA helicase-like protein [Angomonas deanei]|uniref:Helicase conserved C-terminal domain/Helicase associated domain (HA2), putative n=1 Tax=Angomonas deanei TaxID=59799 RepID=A0A7G2C9L8_9TRYP|nr:ATP-dependent RNA helicase-like protein [Angomonas deanei]CAD2215741.1 Helicase conserved C-terminal domain/Helicase associated domain (HA2), putative [Angomonas deanei]|eukprot:EPY27187.1 ATP-dependent RNA helicase-like protein [Angomonas deanei]
MSATLQSDLFSTYFNGAPIINVEGAVYPVQEVYLEDIAQNALHTLGSERSPFTFTRGTAGLLSVPNSFMFETLEQQERGLYGNQRRQFRDLQKSPKTDYYLIAYLIYRSIVCDLKGDVAGKSILVFVPGWKELLAAKQALENVASRNPYGVLLNGQPLRFSIILLHSSVDPQKQRECFSPAPPGHIKVVFATNIAESGITIDDAAVVIDTGLIKQTSWVRSSGAGGGRYFPGQDAAGAGDSYGQFSTQLSLQFASKANCIQRKGRAGRTQGGICYRLFTRLTWSALPEYQRAEIHRVPLTQVLLKLLSLGYAEPKKTLQTFLEPPSTQNVGFSMQLLKHLGAVDTTERLTTLGLYLSKLPCDPRVGKMIMMGALLHCLDSVLTVAAAADLTPYATQRELALEIRKKRYLFARGSQSDHISALNAYNTFCVNMENYQFARHHHLHPHNMQLISKYKWQYRDILLQSGLISGSEVNSVAPAFLLNSAGDHNEKKNGGSPTGIVEDDNVFSPNSYGDANAFDDIGSTYSGDYTNAHQSVYPGQLCVDTSILSEESMDVSLVKACVCAALFPHIAILDPTAPTLGKKKEARKVKLRTKVHASITPSNESACRRVGGPATPESGRPSKQEYMQELVSGGTETKKPPPAMFYVYQDIFTVEEARRSFLTNVSSVSLWALLLFGAGEAQVEYDATLSLCCVDQWIYIRIPSETFHAITSLRECFHACMWRKYNCPSDHTNNAMLEQVRQFSKEVLRAPPVTSNEGDNLAEERETAMYYHRLVDSGSIIPPLIHMNRIGGGQGTSLDHNEDCIREDENNSFDDDWSDDG